MKPSNLIAGEGASSLLGDIEAVVITGVNWVRLILEVAGALMIAIGAVVALTLFVKALLRSGRGDFHTVRLVFARYLSLALEFQLGADILSTAVAPGWEQIGKLAAIAVIRTFLNYFLMHEMAAEASQDANVQRKDALPAPWKEDSALDEAADKQKPEQQDR